MDKWFTRLANVAVIALALVVGYNSLFRAGPKAPPPAFKPGQQLDRARLPISGRSLLLATRSTCQYCTMSMPFYKTLSDVALVAIAVGEDEQTNRRYFAGYGITPQAVIAADKTGLTFPGTPTLVLVDDAGKVIQSWTGRLNKESESELRRLLTQANPTP